MDLSTMTLADAEALAARLETAARTIRDALAMMGGPVSVPSVWTPQPPIASTMTFTPAPASPLVLMTNKGPVRLTDEEQAQKDQLRREREAEELAADKRKLSGL